MEFIKHNFGFLLFVSVGLILALVLGGAWLQTYTATVSTESGVKEQEKVIDQSQRGSFALNQENLLQAQKNRKVTEDAFKDFLGVLVTRYGIPTETTTGLDCVRVLKEQCRLMERDLKDPAKDITLGQNTAKFSFDSILSSPSIPSAEDVPVILKQMRIVEEVVKVAGKSRLREFQSISRPLGLKVINKDLCTVVPLEVSVAGGYKAIQDFVNALQQREALGIFILRSIDLTSQDQVGAGGSIAAMDAMAPGAAPAGRPGAFEPGGIGRPTPMMPFGPGVPRTPATGAGTEKTAPVEVKGSTDILLEKDQRVVFSPHELQARILVDFVEFKNPAEEK